jgi:hypothetical protein
MAPSKIGRTGRLETIKYSTYCYWSTFPIVLIIVTSEHFRNADYSVSLGLKIIMCFITWTFCNLFPICGSLIIGKWVINRTNQSIKSNFGYGFIALSFVSFVTQVFYLLLILSVGGLEIDMIYAFVGIIILYMPFNVLFGYFLGKRLKSRKEQLEVSLN